MYSASLRQRYPALHTEQQTETRGVYTTDEGPILVEQKGGYLFISHTLALPLAQGVEAAMLAAQAGGGSAVAGGPALTAPLRGFLARQGAMRAACTRVY